MSRLNQKEDNRITTKKVRRGVLSCALVLFFLVNAAGRKGDLFSAPPVYAATQESIAQKERQIQDAKKERDAMQKNLTDIKKVKDELEKSKKNLSAYVTQLDGSLTEIQTRIDSLKTRITEKETEIATTEAELETAIETQQNQYEAMKDRIKFMYERGDSMYLEVLSGSGTFAEMLNKANYIEELSAYDRGKLDEYVAQAQLVALTRDALEEEKATLEQAKKDADAEEKNMESLIAEKQVQINGLNADISDKEAAIKAYQDSIAQENAEIAALEKAVAAERAALAEANRRKYDGGMFTWPAPSYTRISDDFGPRIHPTLGVRMQHNGIDLAAPGGSPILAAYNGTVVAAAYSASMGNYVMIDHGDGLYTIYMHASALSVSKGQEVTAGQTIGAVGTTGRSTGNHLHFGVRLNGSYVSPWNYLK